MKYLYNLALKNIKRRTSRSIALITLIAFLAFSVFGGSYIIISLKKGLKSYEARLGADIVVVPNEARSKGTLDAILLQGIPGYFYMDSDNLEKIRAIEGVEIATPQFFLASSSASCCSTSVQIIGFDPDTDFSIQPWIRESYSGQISDGDVIVGSDINIPVSRKLKFYNTTVNIVAQLDKTGTGLDSAVYANMNTIKELMSGAKKLGFNYFDNVSDKKAISSIMIKVNEDFNISEVTDDINIHIRKVEATQSRNMISSIAEGLNSVSGIIAILTVVIWILALVILMIAFVMINNERMKEFAILRALGASKKMLKNVISVESLFLSSAGALIGIGIAVLFLLPFRSLIADSFNMPYLDPGFTEILLLTLSTILMCIAAGLLTSSYSSTKIAKNETGLILREGN